MENPSRAQMMDSVKIYQHIKYASKPDDPPYTIRVKNFIIQVLDD
jgi:hypothetical protein